MDASSLSSLSAPMIASFTSLLENHRGQTCDAVLSKLGESKDQSKQFYDFITHFCPVIELNPLQQRRVQHLKAGCELLFNEKTQMSIETVANRPMSLERLVEYAKIFEKSNDGNIFTQLSTLTQHKAGYQLQIEVLRQFQTFLQTAASCTQSEETTKQRAIKLHGACSITLQDLLELEFESKEDLYFSVLNDDIVSLILPYLSLSEVDMVLGPSKRSSVYLKCPEKLSEQLSQLINYNKQEILDSFLKTFSGIHPSISVRLALTVTRAESASVAKSIEKIQQVFPKVTGLTMNEKEKESPDDTFYRTLFTSCPQLSSLKIHTDSKFTCQRYERFQRLLPRALKEVSLSGSGIFVDSVKDYTKSLFAWCSTVESFSFHYIDIYNPSVSCKLDHFISLRSLDLSCSTIVPSFISESKALTSLNLQNARPVRDVPVQADHFPPTLKALNLARSTDNYQFVPICDIFLDMCFRLQVLEELDLSNRNELTESHFQLAQFPKTLKRLSLRGCNVTSVEVKMILGSCPEIFVLDLTNCPKIPQEFQKKFCGKTELDTLRR